jgi:hypothetical protein
MNRDTPPSAARAAADDFRHLKDGDTDPALNKLIKTLILKGHNFIVYLDEQQCVQWVTHPEYYGDFAPDFGNVVNRAGYLEEIARELLSPRQRMGFQRMVAESVARLLDDRTSDHAKDMLDRAEAYLKARTSERARMWYITAVAVGTCLALLAMLVLWEFRAALVPNMGATAFDLGLATAIGSLGALISVALRLRELNVDGTAGPAVHYFEGAIRVVAGMAGGLLVGLAVKSNLVLGAINSAEKSLALLLAVAAVAGASERVVPDLIKRVEGTISGADAKK